jgi:DNA-binding transcriptional LysR family regulator
LIGAGLNDVDIVAIDSLTAQKRLVEAGFGLALMPESAVQEELRLGTLAIIDAVRLKVSVPIFVVHRERAYLSPAAQSLLDLIRGTRIRPSDAA